MTTTGAVVSRESTTRRPLSSVSALIGTVSGSRAGIAGAACAGAPALGAGACGAAGGDEPHAIIISAHSAAPPILEQAIVTRVMVLRLCRSFECLRKPRRGGDDRDTCDGGR